jgi:hypothetical protein
MTVPGLFLFFILDIMGKLSLEFGCLTKNIFGKNSNDKLKKINVNS